MPGPLKPEKQYMIFEYSVPWKDKSQLHRTSYKSKRKLLTYFIKYINKINDPVYPYVVDMHNTHMPYGYKLILRQTNIPEQWFNEKL